MNKAFLIVFFVLLFLINPQRASAQVNSYVSIVNPVRGDDFWEEKQSPDLVVKNQIDTLKKAGARATWLLRFDVFKNSNLLSIIKNTSDEKGLFLEITPFLTDKAGVKYNKTSSWHSAGSVFLTGYSMEDRVKLIDTSFEGYKKEFGSYPRVVGAWWIDSYSLEYMQQKYGILSAMIVSDQFSTDNYQIWGQYWGVPYYPAKKNALAPAQTKESKIPVVMVQWAVRDPVNGYGKGVEESTYSVQANDYIDYHDLGIDYFSKLVDIYTKQRFNQMGHLVVGLENSYSWEKYGQEYQNQINLLKQKAANGQFKIVTMSEFANVYTQSFPNTSPTQVIVADDPLGTSQKAVWFMNNFYRVGWFYNSEGSVARDIRQYINGSEEICLKNACNELNFATFATRVLDDVTYHQKWLLDQGKISEFKVDKNNLSTVLSYKNSADLERKLEFLSRDISWEGKTSTIDGLILDIVSKQPVTSLNNKEEFVSNININFSGFLNIVWQLLKFKLFFAFFIIIPGFVIVSRLYGSRLNLELLFLSIISGLVTFTFVSLILERANIGFLIYGYGALLLILFLKFKLYKQNFKLDLIANLAFYLLILFGVIFQILPVFRSGLVFDYGVGLWGPNTHDGMWHLSLINQLREQVPPKNPIFGGETLQNYHYFYDLLVAKSQSLTQIPTVDLLFRIFPVVLSLLLGIGTWVLSQKLFNSKLASIIALYFVYFAGSFGFIVSILKKEEWGGESAFWANQAISFNLNPPFAVSLIVVTAIFILLSSWLKKPSFLNTVLIVFLSGTLISFKAYAAILIELTYLVLFVLTFRTRFLGSISLLMGMFILTITTLLSQFNLNQLISSSSGLFLYSPFWFIHSLVDNPDRVGWIKLSAAREAYFQRGEWPKYLLVEAISFFLFIIGNLGIRFFGLLGIYKAKDQKNKLHLLIWSFGLFSLVIPIFFIQKGTPWNTIQFFYYGLFVTSLYAGLVLNNIYKKLPKFIGIIILVTVFIVTPISSATTAKSYLYPYPHSYVSKYELEGLDYLLRRSEGIVLTYPYSKDFKEGISEPYPLYAYDSTGYVSAFSNKTSFIEDEPQNEILHTNYVKRILIAREIFNQKKDFARDNLIKSNIKYIYFLKIFNKHLNEEELDIKKIFENKEVIIYERNS